MHAKSHLFLRKKNITIWLQEQVTFSMRVLDLQEQVNFIILKNITIWLQ